MKKILATHGYWVSGIVALVSILCSTRPVLADQTLTLSSGWNLVSIRVQPSDPTTTSVLAPLIVANKFQAIWAYDAASRAWSSYPATPGSTGIATLEAGKGYWLKVSSSATLTIVEDTDNLPASQAFLQPGWNLIGFPTEVPVSYQSALRDLPVGQLWRFDSNTGFSGFSLLSQTTPPFSEIEPGRGYWVLVTGVSTVDLGGLLGTAMRGDVDLPPLLPEAAPGDRPVFTPLSPGDENIGADQDVACGEQVGDVYFDRPETQRALSFTDNSDTRTINISNEGRGILNWRVSVVDANDHQWIRLRTLDPVDGQEDLHTSLEGSVASGTDPVDLLVDRTGMGPGDYDAKIAIESNAKEAACPLEPARLIPVRMRVADIDGDYQVRAEIDTIDGIPADLPNPRLYLSIYRDGADAETSDDGRIKAIIDDSRTLLFPKRVRLAGGVYQDNTAKFTLSGSFEIPVGNPSNPYQVPLRRDITLVGDRRERNNPADSLLGPQDLKGVYHETIRNVLGQPIHLEGRFTALRVADDASAQDPIDKSGGAAKPITDNVPVIRTVDVTDKMLLTEVDVSVNISHTRPSDLIVSLTSPSGERVVLRDHSNTAVGDVRYDDTATPQDSLRVYKGTLSRINGNGTWTLRIDDDIPGETGTLNSWFLHLKGTRVNTVSGTVTGVGAGATVVITGCGVSFTTTTSNSGAYAFQNMIDCAYRITVLKSGFQRVSQDVVLDGVDFTAANLSPAVAPADVPIPVVLPASATIKVRSLTTSAGAGTLSPRAALRYALDSATYDVDRLPKVGALKCGALQNQACLVGSEDTSEFSSALNQLTQTNLPNIDGVPPDPLPTGWTPPLLPDSTINGPVGVTQKHTHAFVAIGGPIIGSSVAGSMRISIGALP